MPSMPALRGSKERCKSVLHKTRAWPAFRHRETAGEGPKIESRGGCLNRPGDVGNGQFADSLMQLMHRRDHLLDAYTEESVHSSASHASSMSMSMLTEQERMWEEAQGLGQNHELSKKGKRELNLRPGGEPIVVTAYQLVRRLVRDKCDPSDRSKGCCSNPKDQDQNQDRHRHDSDLAQSVRLIDDRPSLT